MRPLLIDCDPGIDDMVALFLACASPETDLIGVTTVAGNVGGLLTTRNALDVLAFAGHPDVPVVAGAARPLVAENLRGHRGAHGDLGLGGARLPQSPSQARDGHAVTFLAEAISRSAAPVTLVATGPLTNVALLFALHPEAAGRLERLVVMGGAIATGNITPAAEFNIWADPEAAHRVLTAPGVDVLTTMVGLDVTLRTLITPDRAAALAQTGRAGRAVADGIAEYLAGTDGGMPMHDAVAVAEAITPGILDCRPCTIEVDYGPGPSRGNTLVSFLGAGTTTVAVGADHPALTEFVLERVATLG
ncbi:nucleoside hydrolase [Catenuloplanes japonicus]|uniref:nucleoside hydrolase n=1 Tax=Catenuloplanes japonicus TaxID=33876 RepID=UPI000525C797|nr:nucleoside hydrolase [Catenuloplanes japonicus]